MNSQVRFPSTDADYPDRWITGTAGFRDRRITGAIGSPEAKPPRMEFPPVASFAERKHPHSH